MLVGADRIDDAAVLLFGERLDRAIDLRLDETAHAQHAGAQRFHLRVELLVRVLVHAASC